MLKIFFGFLGFFLMFTSPVLVFAEGLENFEKSETLEPSEFQKSEMEYFKGTVLSVEKTEERTIYTLENSQKEKVIIEENIGIFHAQPFEKNDKVLYSVEKTEEGEIFILHDFYRLDGIWILIAIFAVFVLLVTKGKGLGAGLGMIFSVFFLFWIVVPELAQNTPPLLVASFGCLVVSTVSMYLAHGFSKRTSFALFSIWITLIVILLFSFFGVFILHLFGMGNDAALLLAMDNPDAFAFQDLLLCGMMFGVLGILDDVVSVQMKAISSLAEANPKFSFWQLFQKGMEIGNEHIFSMINTLFLVYFGAALPLIIMLFVGSSDVISFLNSENMVEEIFQTWAGSIGILLAVPISSFLAAFLEKKNVGNKSMV